MAYAPVTPQGPTLAGRPLDDRVRLVIETPVQIIVGVACLHCQRPFAAADAPVDAQVPILSAARRHPECPR